MMTHDHPAVRNATLKLISSTHILRDDALVALHDPSEQRLDWLRESAAKVRAHLDALDAAIAQAQAGEAA